MTVITVDGPSGAGKGTVVVALSKILGFDFLDSGALYRLVALQALRSQVSDDVPQLVALATTLPVQFLAGESGQSTRVLLEGEDVSDEIRTETVAAVASEVAALAPVRSALLARQRAFDQGKGLIADGRDMGTVVFPKAELKIFLTASAKERARRRYLELQNKGENVNINNILRDIETRDARDQNRAISPLLPAADAVILDTSKMNKNQVLGEIKHLIEKYKLKKNEISVGQLP